MKTEHKTNRPKYLDYTLLYSDGTSSFASKIVRYANDSALIVQPKYDGRWGTLIKESSDTLSLWSRHGKLQGRWTHSVFEPLPMFELHGEYMFGTSTAKGSDLEGCFMAFDCVFLEDKINASTPFWGRLSGLLDMTDTLKDVFHKISAPLDVRLVDHQRISAYRVGSYVLRDVIDYFLEQDYEGVVIKRSNGLYGDPFVRIKPIYDMDYVVMGFNQSDAPKYKGKMVKSIIAGLYVDGVLTPVCNVSGLNEEDRTRFYERPNDYIGKVITCSGKDVFPSGALRHPNFVRFHAEKRAEDCLLPEKS